MKSTKRKHGSFNSALSICLIVAMAAALFWPNAKTASAYSNAVVPINWSDFTAGNPTDSFSLQLVSAIKNANKYAVNDWYNVVKNYDAQTGTYLTFGGNAETNVRPPAFQAEALAVSIRTGIYDAAYTGVSLNDAKEITLKLIRSLAYRHIANSAGGWGNHWQSAQWAGVAGYAGFLMWDDLSSTDREYVRKMVEYEANRFNLATPPASNPVNKDSGDTYAEETAWNTNAIALAATMMPNHANNRTWMYRLNFFAMQAGMRKTDDSSSMVNMNGKFVRDWTNGWELLGNGTVINHGRIHPDYMVSVVNGRMLGAFAFALSGQSIPQSLLFNNHIIYSALVDYNFKTSDGYFAPGGTIYKVGSSDIYYPEGNDWGQHRKAHFTAIDSYADAFGFDNLATKKGAYWGPYHAQKVLDMQSRFTNGRTYLDNTEDSYSGREEWVANYMCRAYMAQWLKHQNAIATSNADFSYQAADLLLDDFEDGDSSGWASVNGTWSVVTDGSLVYRQSSASGEALSTTGILNYRDYYVMTRLKILSGSNAAAGIVGRYSNANNYYMLRLHEALDKLQLYKNVGGTFTLLSEVDYMVSKNTWYTLKLDMMGTIITGSVNGVPLISARDNSFSSGKAGVRTYGAAVSYDDFGLGHN